MPIVERGSTILESLLALLFAGLAAGSLGTALARHAHELRNARAALRANGLFRQEYFSTGIAGCTTSSAATYALHYCRASQDGYSASATILSQREQP